MVEQLTRREGEVLDLLVAGNSTKQIAFLLGITFKTAACHRYNIMAKFGAHNAAELVGRALRGSASQAEVTIPASQNASANGLAGADVLTMLIENRQEREKLRDALSESRTLCVELKELRQELRAVRQQTHSECARLLDAARDPLKVNGRRGDGAP